MKALIVALLIVTALVREAVAQDFYAGKTINLIVGYSAGGGYDQYARLLARHFGRHIPGHPNIVVQNMPGAATPDGGARSRPPMRRVTAPPSPCSIPA